MDWLVDLIFGDLSGDPLTNRVRGSEVFLRGLGPAEAACYSCVSGSAGMSGISRRSSISGWGRVAERGCDASVMCGFERKRGGRDSAFESQPRDPDRRSPAGEGLRHRIGAPRVGGGSALATPPSQVGQR
jgi:hypothetical protein